ncbi:T9SS type A sorting domain-containing protein [Chryseobacterium sp. NKUCC03_KSP]|uniref:T9SS type A sorting domain-containing protein n=1 Tax=Chryseobacterium sp. NKUCC03_KSP TaxID=2842125 RepID=UPI001C5BADB8|nr:T9SS type A sorting domain-containing protein [Chryseobacterium sp. NKUCC03_KSP]MBW3522575.1 T9SS type A sorting domain-containing protein [Chryseobacterium sp. NKUCC03_KSP]
MKRNQSALMLAVLGIFTSSLAFAQNYQTMPITSGLNADVIANGIGSSSVTTNNDVDGVSYAFVARDFQLTASSTPITYGIPVNGTINSIVTATPGLGYQLESLSANNSLRLAAVNDSGILTFTTPKAATKLYMLSTSGSGGSTVSVTVNFSDGTSQQFTGISVADWYTGTNIALQGFGRIKKPGATPATGDDVPSPESGTNPRLYQNELAIDAANQAKLIQSVTVAKTAGTGIPNVFAFSADVYSTCAPPVLQAATNVTANGVTLNWAASSSAQAATYGVYYSTSSTAAPTSTTAPMINNISGVSTPISSLSSNTTYYYWVRTNCGGATAESVWSFMGTFKTACGPMTSMTENFDSYATGTTLADCWIRLVNSTGTLSISSSTPASGTRNIYQYSSASQNPTVAVLPEFSNVNAGTHWLRFNARVSSATGTLNVGYVTNPSDASTFVLIQALSVSNTNYTSSNPEYTVAIPSTVPANARLAIKNTADGKSYYWDDVNWEAIPNCLQPANVTVTSIEPNNITLNWTAPSSAPSSGYEYYYSTTATLPTATTVPSGTSAAGSTSKVVSGLTSNTVYYIWMRSACSTTEKSVWTYQTSFQTLCLPMTSLFENFDSYTTGNTLPDCWVRLAGTGSLSINSTSPASGTRNIYQYTSTTSTPSIAVLPSFSNVNSGAYRLRFKARTTSSAGGTLNVGYVTNAADASTFVLIEALSITNTSYTAANAEYTVNIPATVPPGARLAIRTLSDAKTYYWDDLNWEDLNALGTSEVSKENKITIYPNPFSDVLFISNIENVKTIKVSDLTGRVMKVIENPSKEINLSSLHSGLYLITMSYKDGSQNTVKAIKK